VERSELPHSPLDFLIRDITRWRRILGVAVLVLVVIRLVWGLEAQRKLDSEIHTGLAKGEPARLADLKPSIVRDHPDAIRAFMSLEPLEWPEEFYTADIRSDPPALAFNHPAVLQKFMSVNHQQIELLQAAHNTDWTDTPVPVATSEGAERIPAVNDAFLYELAVAALSRSDHALAFDYVLDLYRCADLQAATWQDSHDAQYAASNSRDKAARFLERYGGRLVFDDGRSGVARSIPRSKVRHLISRLTQDQDWIAQSGHFMLQERAKTLQDAAESTSRHWLEDLVYGPSRRMEHASAAHWLSLASSAVKEPSLPKARRILPSTSSVASVSGNWPEDKAIALVDQHYLGLATQRLIAMLLASRLYWTDHGYDPRSLEDLVPQYLPGVPKDPCDPADHAIRMKPSSSGLLFYSVGYNGVDDGGTWSNSLFWWTVDFGLNPSPASAPQATATTMNSR